MPPNNAWSRPRLRRELYRNLLASMVNLFGVVALQIRRGGSRAPLARRTDTIREKSMRKWLAFLLAVIVLAVIHEGTHAVVAAFYNEYEGFRIRP